MSRYATGLSTLTATIHRCSSRPARFLVVRNGATIGQSLGVCPKFGLLMTSVRRYTFAAASTSTIAHQDSNDTTSLASTTNTKPESDAHDETQSTNDTPHTPTNTNAKSSMSLIVRNLPADVHRNTKKLAELFEPFGAIRNMRVLPPEPGSEAETATAVLTFFTPRAASLALTEHAIEPLRLAQCTLELSYPSSSAAASSPTIPDRMQSDEEHPQVLLAPSETLWVGNVPRSLHQDEVREAFERYGRVKEVRVLRSRTTRKRLHYLFVEYFSLASAQRAVEVFLSDPASFVLDNTDGVRLEVRYAPETQGFAKARERGLYGAAFRPVSLDSVSGARGEEVEGGEGMKERQTEPKWDEGVDQFEKLSFKRSLPASASLYVRGLPEGIDARTVERVFGRWGECAVESLWYTSTDSLRASCILTFPSGPATASAVLAAHRANRITFSNPNSTTSGSGSGSSSRIHIDYYSAPEEPENAYHTLHVTGFEGGEEGLREVFKPYERFVRTISVPGDVTWRGKPVGFVEFYNAAQAVLAKQILAESPPPPPSLTPSASTAPAQPLRISFARPPKPPRQNAKRLDLPGHFKQDQGDASFAYGLEKSRSARAARRREPRLKEKGWFNYEKADWERGVEEEERRERKEEQVFKKVFKKTEEDR